jgi:hypothetical protein
MTSVQAVSIITLMLKNQEYFRVLMCRRILNYLFCNEFYIDGLWITAGNTRQRGKVFIPG